MPSSSKYFSTFSVTCFNVYLYYYCIFGMKFQLIGVLLARTEKVRFLQVTGPQQFMRSINSTRKAVMHCNLRSPYVAPVVLDFNYETGNAPAYKSVNSQPPRTNSVPSYQISTQPDSARQVYQARLSGAIFVPLCSQSWGNHLRQIWGI